MTKTPMSRKFALNALLLAGTAGMAAIVPTEAYAALSTGASAAAVYWQEIALGIGLVAGVIYLDTASWSLMTDRARRARRD